MSKFWEDVKGFVKQGATAVVEKTEELSKVGKIKIDIMGIERNFQKTLSKLGGQVYHLVVEAVNANIADDEKVKQFIEKAKDYEKQLEAKKQELEEVGKKEESESTESETVGEELPANESEPVP